MRIHSFVRKGMELVSIEVELNLLPGVNQLQIMGLPDTAIRESGLKIKSALKTQGFKWPAGQQILVNLRPSHWRKSSRGLELAIACAYLWKSGQMRPPEGLGEDIYVYGELGLDGKVYAPGDLDSLFNHSTQAPIFTGHHDQQLAWSFLMIKDLKGLRRPEKLGAKPLCDFKFEATPLPQLDFPTEASKLLKIVSLGEHATLVAGPAGSGKTTLARGLHALLGPPPSQWWPEMARVKRWFSDSTPYRPFVSPHHSVSPSSMIGGGFPVFPGEITRAHGGLLLLDEFLEFPAQVKESLREPLESGEIIISRRGQNQTLPARFLLLATTNLCHCGRLVPERRAPCRFSLTRCRSYLERMSGPMLDRFDVLAFSSDWAKTGQGHSKNAGMESMQSIFEHVEKARLFQRNRQMTEIQETGSFEVNGRTDETRISQTLPPFVRENLLPTMGDSRRRMRALMRVARTLADLDENPSIQLSHLNEASQWAWKNFENLNQIFA